MAVNIRKFRNPRVGFVHQSTLDQRGLRFNQSEQRSFRWLSMCTGFDLLVHVPKSGASRRYLCGVCRWNGQQPVRAVPQCLLLLKS